MTHAPDEPQILAVDEHDRPLGAVGKAAAHRNGGQLHRAFTLVLANDRGDLLWAQRSPSKPLWPGAWDATVASHPEADASGAGAETFEAAGERRVREELGLDPTVPLEVRDAGRFRYRLEDGQRGVEHEVCAALFARLPDDLDLERQLRPEPGEVSALRMESLEGFLTRGECHLHLVAPWACFALEAARRSGWGLGHGPQELGRALSSLAGPAPALDQALAELGPRAGLAFLD
ncbi:MAG: NUDIX hydrolase [Planctomycetota bacterium]|jgi:isopentenyl-diphosphate delta-isomerase